VWGEREREKRAEIQLIKLIFRHFCISCKKCLLALSCPSTNPSILHSVHMYQFSSIRIIIKFDTGDLPDIKSGTLHEDLSTFYCCRGHKITTKAVLTETKQCKRITHSCFCDAFNTDHIADCLSCT
jgi:hypothetical protein